jgi:UDP-2-acetamido-3-amino-2,3-dideoxy-glucuronate N-acetyltransferase
MPIADDVELAEGVIIYHPELVNLYGCSIGKDTTIGPFVEVGRGVTIGARCKISTHSYLCSGVTIEDDVFVGHGVMFVNDIEPIATVAGRRINVEERSCCRFSSNVGR